MDKPNYRSQVEELLDEWADTPKQGKDIINCLVEFLAGDVSWLYSNISMVDRVNLVSIAKSLDGMA